MALRGCSVQTGFSHLYFIWNFLAYSGNGQPIYRAFYIYKIAQKTFFKNESIRFQTERKTRDFPNDFTNDVCFRTENHSENMKGKFTIKSAYDWNNSMVKGKRWMSILLLLNAKHWTLHINWNRCEISVSTTNRIFYSFCL